MDIYAVVGNPVAHSKSPKIHNLFASQTAQNMEYTAIQSPLEAFTDTVTRFFANGGCGLNVTVPFKEQAWSMAQVRTPRAELAGAVNTLYQQDGVLHGDNTDGAGLVRDLVVNNGQELKGKRILILGAGGAVRGVLMPILEKQPALITLANRTLSKAQALAEIFSPYGNLESSGFERLQTSYDLVINGTSASLAGDLPPISPKVISSETVTYDMMYGNEATVFNAWAAQQGAALCIDGLGMLVEQAAEAFAIWRGVRPVTDTVLAGLRAGN
ncbi:shikimate dehydrogenase [Hahella sp. CCB-MM4]|uniref:shikimate dehydrogenase n=1 Tax=Hahella sp. (strain CCB-MM4) TaxID=1926491 RepID=UPI000BD85E45|nr:shikimate dehydrogenase [Hahella sp. CCB-MM4]OZG73261.1 shikimate dehydrogenase [Hahella sp. CCB-MM4]